MKIHMIYMAAGNSRRFQENKLLYSLAGKPLYRYGLEKLLHLKEEREDRSLLVVTQYLEIEEELKEEGIPVIFSPRSCEGASFTIRAAIEAIQPLEKEDYLLFMVADQPFLTERTISRLLQKVKEKPEIAAVSWENRAGNPVLFSAELAGELLNLTGDMGGRAVMKKHQVQLVPAMAAGELRDIDYKEQLQESAEVYPENPAATPQKSAEVHPENPAATPQKSAEVHPENPAATPKKPAEVYLDNAATTLHKPQQVIDAMVRAMQTMGNAGRGVNAGSLTAGRHIYEVRCQISDFFGGYGPEQVVFTANATESLNMAIRGLLRKGDHVITTEMEHNSVLRPLYELEENGTELSILTADDAGRINVSEIPALIRENTRAIVCTHASNVTGNVNDLGKIAELAKEHNLLLIVDASQTAGEIPIDMKKLGIDVLCFTGHKGLMGPQGIGGLLVKPGLEIHPLLSGGTGIFSFLKTQPEQMPEHLEAGTLNGPGIAGLGAAISYIQEIGADTIRSKEQHLTRLFQEMTEAIPGVSLYGDFRQEDRQDFRQEGGQEERCPIVALNIDGLDSAETGDILLQEYGISTRTGAHCAPLMHRRLQTVEQGIVRFSFSWFNKEEEVLYAAMAVRDIAREIM